MFKMYWKKRKTFAMLSNKRQWERDFDPTETAAQEILMEHLTSHWLVTESSNAGTPTYIITE